jgi:ATP dependent DNA ligase domain
MPPVSPMLAKSVASIPPEASYEPKWDGFRSICFRDGDQVELGSRNERPMTRYFPELVAAATAELPEWCVIDGEIVIATERRPGAELPDGEAVWRPDAGAKFALGLRRLVDGIGAQASMAVSVRARG